MARTLAMSAAFAFALTAAAALPAHAEQAGPSEAQATADIALDLRDLIVSPATLVLVSRNESGAERAVAWLRAASAMKENEPHFDYFVLDIAADTAPVDSSGLVLASQTEPAPSAHWFRAAGAAAAVDQTLWTPGGESINAFLVDADGRVRWRAEGGVTPEAIVRLGRALEFILEEGQG